MSTTVATATEIRPFRIDVSQEEIFNEVGRGGHFAAWEEPQLFAEEIRAAFRSLR